MLTIRRGLWITVACLVAGTPAAGVAQEQGFTQEKDEAKLVAVLKSDASEFDKAKACQRLAAIGGKESIPVLASMLGDEKLAHYARFGLETNPDPAVDAALRAALAKLEGKPLVGAINSLGFRRDAKAAGELAKHLGDRDVQVAAAAAAALGRIATADAAKTLQKALAESSPELRPPVADAFLTLAEQLVAKGHGGDAKDIYNDLRKADVPKHHKLAATRWAIVVQQSTGVPLLLQQLKAKDDDYFAVALRASRDMAGEEITKTLAAEIDRLPAARQARLIAAIGDRRDAAASAAVLKAAKSGSPELRAAAIRVLAKLGDARAAAVLMETAFSESEMAAEARAALASLPGKEVDAAVIAKLKAGDATVRRIAIELAGQRRMAGALPALLKAADDPDEQVRVTAVTALGSIIDPNDLTVLIARLLKPKSPQEAAAAQEALQTASVRAGDREATADKLIAVLPQASPEAKSFLFDLLARIGGSNALKAVAAAAKGGDEAGRDAATRVLGEWMSPDAAPVLLELAKAASDEKYKIRALRGYIRIARQLKVSGRERMTICREALAVAWRDDEKRLVLDVLARNPSPQTLALVVDQLESKTLKGPAAATAVKMAEKMVGSQPRAVAHAMEHVLEAGVRGEQAERAKSLLEQAKKP